VANYCGDRIHLVLTEELNKIAENNSGGVDFDLKKKWEEAFSDCFKKVDKETDLFTHNNIGSTAVVCFCFSHYSCKLW
jgi:hypothetical protein